MKAIQKSIAAAVLATSLLWAAGAASAAPQQGDSTVTTTPAPGATTASRSNRAEVERIADSIGVSPERLKIECTAHGNVFVYWNGHLEGHWWDPYCAFGNWVDSLF